MTLVTKSKKRDQFWDRFQPLALLNRYRVLMKIKTSQKNQSFKMSLLG